MDLYFYGFILKPKALNISIFLHNKRCSCMEKKRLILETIFILILILISMYLITFVTSAKIQNLPVTTPANGTYLQLTNTTEYINCTFNLNVSNPIYGNLTFRNATLYVANISGTITTSNYNLTYNASNSSSTAVLNYTSRIGSSDGTVMSLNGTTNNTVSVTWKINETFRIPGMYIYACRVESDNITETVDPGVELNWSTNKTIIMDGHTPNVTTVLPVNSTGLTPNVNWSDATVTFSVTAMDENLANCTLYHNFNGTWERNTTVTIDNNANTEVASLTLATNTTGMIWTIACDDYAGFRKTNFSGGGSVSNYTIKVDADAPSLTLSPSASKTLQQGQSQAVSCTQSDGAGVGTVTLTIGGVEQTCTEGQRKGSCTATYVASGTGDYVMKCTGADILGNAASNKEITLTVESGATAGVGGGTGGGPITPTQESITPTTTGTQVQPFTGTPFSISVAGATYPVEVTSVGATTATITTGSSSNEYAIGETKQIDLNDDGDDDIELTLDDISLGRAVFTVKEIEVKIPEEAGAGEEGLEEEVGITKKPGVVLGIIIAIIVILAGLYYFTRKK